jgi:hypothetical protein
VDWKTLGLVDYPTIVQKPMDIGTIKNKLTGNCYNVVEDCLDDIQMVWDNCKLYNAKDTVRTFLPSGSTNSQTNSKRSSKR